MPPQFSTRLSKYICRFPNRIRDRRLELQLRQVDLADRMKRRLQTISSWERGLTAPRTRDLLVLAAALETTAEYLYWRYYATNDPLPPFVPPDSQHELRL